MRPTGSDILVVDDEADIRDLVSGLLEDEGHAVRVAANSDEALAAIRARKPSLAILDIWMQGGGLDGLELLEVVKELDPDLPVVMISGHGNIETAVTALKRGAYDFIEKPFKSDRLVVVVERAIEAATLRRENRRLRAQTMTPSGLIGRSQAAQALRSTIAKVAQANSRVLISGPAGSGKELVARQIHEGSPRARAEFVAISAAGMTPERLDVELFGEEGQDGRPRKIGVFERAHNGTLYLDEISDMPRESQSRILRVLVDQRFRRVGGEQDVQVDVRVVTSTSRDLKSEIAEGRFREDLFHRLNVVPIRVPGPVGKARGHRRTGRIFRGHHQRLAGPAQADRRRRCGGGAAGSSVARQHPPAAQQYRTSVDPGDRRPGRDDHRRHAAAGGGDIERRRGEPGR